MGIKQYIYIALVIGAIAFVVWALSEAKETGYNECKLEVEEKNDAALDVKVKELGDKLKEAQANTKKAREDAQHWKDKVKEIEDEWKNKPKAPPVVITKTVPTEHCTTVDTSIIELYNSSGEMFRRGISIANGEVHNGSGD